MAFNFIYIWCQKIEKEKKSITVLLQMALNSIVASMCTVSRVFFLFFRTVGLLVDEKKCKQIKKTFSKKVIRCVPVGSKLKFAVMSNGHFVCL